MLYSTDDMSLIKLCMTKLFDKKDIKTINRLLCCNKNTHKLDSRELNEAISQENKRCDLVLCSAYFLENMLISSIANCTSDDVFIISYYDPSTKIIGI